MPFNNSKSEGEKHVFFNKKLASKRKLDEN